MDISVDEINGTFSKMKNQLRFRFLEIKLQYQVTGNKLFDGNTSLELLNQTQKILKFTLGF